MQIGRQLPRAPRTKAIVSVLTSVLVLVLVGAEPLSTYASDDVIDTVAKVFPTGATLRGAEASTSQMVRFSSPASRQSDPVLDLRMSISGAVDAADSVLTVLVDGEPLQTRYISQWIKASKSEGIISVGLGRVSEGFHRVEVRTQLRDRRGATCVDEQRVWLRLFPATVRWKNTVGASIPAPDGPLALRDYRQLWQGHRAVAIRMLHGDADTGLDSDAVEALLRLDHLIRRQGLLPIWPGTSAPKLMSGVPPEVHLSTDVTPLGWSAPLGPQELGAVVKRGVMSLHAYDFRTIAEALGGLEDAAVLAHCSGPRCVFGPYKKASGPGPGHAVPARSAAVADVSLHALGYTQPRTLRGFGEHSLQIKFSPPKHWDVIGKPFLKLNLRRPAFSPAVHAESQLVVELNGEPIGSLGLEGLARAPQRQELGSPASSKTQQLIVALPIWAKELPLWEFTVRVHWIPRDERCDTQKSPLGPWVAVEPDSALVLPRRTYRAQSIAGVVAAAAQRERTFSVDGALMLADLAHAAPVLYAIDGRRSASWKQVRRCAHAFCVRIQGTVSHSPSMMEAAGSGPDAFWFAPSGRLRMPRLPIQGTSFLAVVAPATKVPYQPDLRLWVPEGPRVSTAQVPDVTQLNSSWAATGPDGWLGIESVQSARARGEAPLATYRHERRVDVDEAWGSGGAVPEWNGLAPKSERPSAQAAAASRLPTDEQRLEKLRTIAWAVGGFLLILLLWRLLRTPSIRPMEPDDVEWHESST